MAIQAEIFLNAAGGDWTDAKVTAFPGDPFPASDPSSASSRDGLGRLVIAFPTGGLGGNAAHTVERLRIRRAA